MKTYIIVLLLCVTVEIDGCFKSSTPASTPPPTSHSSSRESSITASNIHGSNAAPKNPKPSGSGSPVNTAVLKILSEELYHLDTNAVGSKLKLNTQGRTDPNNKNDVAPQPLFSNVNPNILQGETWQTFQKLLNNYDPDVKRQEDNTNNEKKEVDAFLDAVMKTAVMKKTEQFLKTNGYIRGSLRPELKNIWFTPYTRHKGVVGSSGFEHVFIGEIKSGKVSGFHNWLYFQKEEKEKDVNYKGYLKLLDLGTDGDILKMRFDWLNKPKAVGSMFVGTSPELEMALYTVCFYTRSNKGCNLKMNNEKFRIKVYTQNYGGKKLIGSAYPEIF